MSQTLDVHSRIPLDMAGYRLDQAAAELFADYSRERLKGWIKDGSLTLDGAAAKPKDKVHGGERLVLKALIEDDTRFEAQDIPLEVVFEDDQVLVVNKPPGLVVHPAAGNPDGTLLNALLHHFPDAATLPRAGIVHRLDKDTSGLMVVAKSLAAHADLVAQLQARSVSREYDAIVVGKMTSGGTVDAPIGRHPKDRKRQAVTASGKPAVTHYRVVERFRAHTHVRCKLETGRTHQIRVHMAHRRFPLIGDPVYGGRLKLPPGAEQTLKEILREFPRQALHARRLAFVHPSRGEEVSFQAPLPDDLLMLLDFLRDDAETMQ
ncbi:23S rRNA pseudouridine(1911/1915/1917) synthase RluD [Halomonas litopenaei]|uniref:Pseudouridine synthase n=2 Tax=Halomonas TaxID=2745 RepID=A0AAU7KTE4_9GAMM|nr:MULTISPECIES: 23S rRNA pseudouridine(1911/1915/1917) synthase RluD [Halomonas]MAR73717.1 23S rRNA pseudouridine(1911/1915/1917) synthase RluD [Halomonas sp.]MBY5942448.1 23S rRNA pseudouridine(1911/1915/1917) synthase RluD [Halomonas sp. DP5N14-9]PTL88618.1 23S rRNA pseudouridine(1911/1915/1917) synthase RluD [Halomonas sp. SYSU XM8]PTL92038.1 23S rRNA pseudouridine(1911/1915/1917) synthase RluD [Halomonas litopenaei]RQW68899.1 23S rRNA pseudouridine(1911/1915/1917) synthase RluD [Halomonas|tara:strand:+ start:10835 stop:11794 length:960 start_codon:yes stop_codon:yes gene_type:complete